MQMRQALQSFLLCGLAACSFSADLQDEFTQSEYRLPLEERLRIELAAPVIVAGTVLNVAEIGLPSTSKGDPRIKTQLTEIEIDVEVVVKGTAPGPTMKFYLFTYSSQNKTDLGVPRYLPERGQRRVFFLRRAGQLYRSIGDVTNYNLAVATGKHPSDICRGKAAGCCIAELLLVPEHDYDRDWFLRELGPATYAAGTLCSPHEAIEILRRLSGSSDARIRSSVDDILSMAGQWWPSISFPR